MNLEKFKEIEEKYVNHWAERLEPGDRCKATIRHKTDGSKNLHNVEIIVVENLHSEEKIVGYFKKRKKQIQYNELSPAQN